MSAEAEITGQRRLTVGRAEGSTQWKVTEFSSAHVLLVAEAANAGFHFAAHFNAKQWAEFQALVAGGQS